jgi:hypothetical protein
MVVQSKIFSTVYGLVISSYRVTASLRCTQENIIEENVIMI